MRAAGWLVIASLGCAHPAGEPALADVTRADLVITVDVAGELAAVDATELKPPSLPDVSSFKIGWLAPDGSEVLAGAPIATFDAGELDRSLENLQTQADEARTRLDQAREQAALARREEDLRMLEREASLRKTTLVADVPADLVASNTRRADALDLAQAKAELALARDKAAHERRSSAAEIQSLVDAHASVVRQIDQITHSRAHLTLASPRAGTVVYATSYGEKKKIGDTVYLQDVILQVVGPGAMVGNGEVDEVDIARIALHTPVALRLDALPDVGLHGTVASIAGSVLRSAAEATNVVRIQVAVAPTTACALRPGMRFRGRVEVQRIPDVIQVPADAVFVTPEGPVAYREAAGGTRRVRVSLGQRSTDAVEVTSGLSPGDRVSRVAPEPEAP